LVHPNNLSSPLAANCAQWDIGYQALSSPILSHLYSHSARIDLNMTGYRLD